MSRPPVPAKPYTIGRSRFKQINAVEGLSLSYNAGCEFDDDDAHGLSPEERRRRIIDKYTRS